MPSDEPIHLPASFNSVSETGILFVYISCCYVGQASDKLWGCQEQPFVYKALIKFEYITKILSAAFIQSNMGCDLNNQIHELYVSCQLNLIFFFFFFFYNCSLSSNLYLADSLPFNLQLNA